MPLEHEYALVGGFNRSHVGRWLARVAAIVSAFAVFLLLAAVDVARSFRIDANIPPAVMSLVGAGMVYTVLYWVFDRFAWKFGSVGRLLKVPDLSGTWRCAGESREREPGSWTGVVRIVQSWDRIRVHLETGRSTSDSVAAALLHDAAAGYRLMYHYRNHPRIGETDMAAHHGFAELVFHANGAAASGEYFNGRGRNTYGVMELNRENA